MSKPRHPAGRRLRKGRWSSAGQIYVVTFVTEDRAPWFRDLGMCRTLIRIINLQQDTDTLAFVIMPDHVHWLLQLNGLADLSKVVQGVKSTSAHRLNRLAGRTGKFWQPGYHDHAVRNEGALRDIARYVVANPIRAELVKSVRMYSHWDAIWV